MVNVVGGDTVVCEMGTQAGGVASGENRRQGTAGLGKRKREMRERR
jgi:hypothetical protein